MKVLLVTNMYPSKEFPTYGIFVKEQQSAIERYHRDVEFIVFYINGKLGMMEYLKSILRINQLIKRNNFDLIHIHYGLSGLFLLSRLSLKVPVLVTLHGGDIQVEQGKKVQVFLTKQILKCAQMAVTLNARMDSITKKYIKNTVLVPCSVNTEIFVPKKEIKPSSSVKRIVFPSDRSRMVKNYPLFEEVIKLLKSKYNINCETFEVKNMNRQQVADLYNSADLMLMTSISEGSPQVVKEAMACNLPVVSTNVGDVEVLLANVQGSAVSKSGSAEELAGLCYKSLCGDFNGIKGRDKIFELELDDKNIATKVYNIYKSLSRHK